MTTEEEHFVYLIEHSKLQPWQKNLLSSSMGMRAGQINLVLYGRQCGKTQFKNEYIRLIGKICRTHPKQINVDKRVSTCYNSI